MDTASSSYDMLPVTSPSEPAEGLGKEEVVGVFLLKLAICIIQGS